MPPCSKLQTKHFPPEIGITISYECVCIDQRLGHRSKDDCSTCPKTHFPITVNDHKACGYACCLFTSVKNSWNWELWAAHTLLQLISVQINGFPEKENDSTHACLCASPTAAHSFTIHKHASFKGYKPADQSQRQSVLSRHKRILFTGCLQIKRHLQTNLKIYHVRCKTTKK